MSATTTDPAVLGALATLHAAVAGVFRVHGVPMPTPPPTPRRSKLAVAILSALAAATVPMRGKALAKAAGHKPAAHFRSVASQLKREGLVVRVKGGYVIAPPP